MKLFCKVNALVPDVITMEYVYYVVTTWLCRATCVHVDYFCFSPNIFTGEKQSVYHGQAYLHTFILRTLRMHISVVQRLSNSKGDKI